MLVRLRAALVAAAVAVAAPAAHGGVALQGSVTASAGVTDNVYSSPTEPQAGTKGRATDLIVTVTPGLILTTGAARAVQRLAYFFNGIVYARNTDADTYNNQLTYNGFFLPSKTTTFGLNLGLTQGRISTFNNLTETTNAQAQVLPAAIINQLAIQAEQSFSWEMTARWRLSESLGFSTVYLIDTHPAVPTTRTVPGRVAAEYSFAHDIVGADVGVAYTNYPEQRGPVTDASGVVDPNGIVTPNRNEMIVNPLVRWRRDFSYFLNVRAQLGCIAVLDPGDARQGIIEPAGGAGLNFVARRVSIDVEYLHGATPNALLRATFLADTATLRGSFVLSEKYNFYLSLGASYSYGRRLDETLAVQARAHVLTADAALSYAPIKALSIFLRYQVNDQVGYKSDLFPIPTMYRNTLLLGLAAIYPAEIAAVVPRNKGVRVDGTDAPTISSSKSTPK